MLGRTITQSIGRDGAAAVIRLAREAERPDPVELVRRIDLPAMARLRELPGSALSALPVRRRRRGPRRAITVGLLVVALTLIAIRLARRQMDRTAARVESARLDRAAIERAAAEGMGTAIGAGDPVAVPMDMSVPDEDVERLAIGEQRIERTVIDQASNGLGIAPRA